METPVSVLPYLRTYRSTVSKLKEAVGKEHCGLKRAVHDVEEAVGGLEFCSSKGALPRGARQASYFKTIANEKVVDPILDITRKMKMESERGADKISLDDDSPKVVLFSDDQVDDLVNFCCNDVVGHNSLIYVDVTFFVLMTTYKNTTVFTKLSDPPSCPLMIGPMMLCMLKEKTTYLTLFQKLTAQVPGLKVYLQGYSTDAEVPLRQALAQELEQSLSFLCKIHAERNMKEKCHKLRFIQSLTNAIVGDIFGNGGLIFADTEEAYQHGVENLTSKWDALESAETGKPPQFSKYIRVYKSDDIWHRVTAKVSRDASFEDQAQTNNAPESGNALLKRWQDFQTSDMSSFMMT